MSERGTPPDRWAGDSGGLEIHLIDRPVGRETYQLTQQGDTLTLATSLDVTDRGTHLTFTSTLRTSPDFTPVAFRATGKTYRFVNVDVDIAIRDHAVQVTSLGDSSTQPVPSAFFTSRGYAPLSGRAILIRYWEAHGRPASIQNIPGGSDASIEVAFRGVDTVRLGGRRLALRRYAVDGVVWGRETVWLDANNTLAAIVTRIHILPMEAVRSDIVAVLPQLQASAVRDRMRELATMQQRVKAVASGSFALVGARVISGTTRAPIEDASLIIRDGHVVSVGPRSDVRIPAGMRILDASGTTIIPGLWDMHGHVSQIEWAPASLAAGVTTVRDMGGERAFLTAFRDALEQPNAIGPTLLLAGLIDGPGPTGFGATIATTPAEGRAEVDRLHAQGFRQVKLYNAITAPVSGAIIRRAHDLGMTVTGHVPTAMGLRAIVDSGMDHVAHLPFGNEAAAERRELIEVLARHRTVMDPTVVWNELLGRAPSTRITEFEPGIVNAPSPLALNYASVRNSTDVATAAAARARSLSAIKELHDAGVPIVAGTDGAVPGYSLLRELELSVAAGLTPLEAIQTATTVAAQAMGMERTVGSVEAGKRADLVVLEANPLDDISNLRRARWVIRGGRVYDPASLWRLAGFR
ncbi:MAG: amidohydrolase family protein [Gemmatimonadaceae bacterium]